ncbi:MAG: LCP family protein [Clostridia bacterium]|nr:LCP family protein [Clostridia bacterium]
MAKARKIITILLIVCMFLGIFSIGSWIVTGNPPQLLNALFPAKSRTVLILGMDNGGLRSDVMMVAFINGRTGNVDIVSIPRDTKVRIGKLTSAHAIGGVEQTKETIEELLDIEIDNYVKFSFQTFNDVVDALGGVDYYVPQDMYHNDPTQDLLINLKEGMQHLDGDEAQQLVRFRGYPMGDEQRIKVQQDFIKELVKQKANLGIVFRLPDLISKVGETVETDIPQNQWLGLGNVALKMDKTSVSTYQMPGSAQYIGRVSYYLQDEKETEKLIDEILERQKARTKPKKEEVEG